VMGLKQAVEARLLGRAADLGEAERPQLEGRVLSMSKLAP
jgi:hypothetical protein